MSGSRYLELVERLGVRFRPGGYTPVDIKTTVELVDEVQQAAEAIRELLALVGEMAEAVEPVSKAFSQVEFHQGRTYSNEIWIPIGLQLSDLQKCNAVLQKAREATGEAKASSATMPA